MHPNNIIAVNAMSLQIYIELCEDVLFWKEKIILLAIAHAINEAVNLMHLYCKKQK
jgi:hypothetical protein